MSSFFSHQFMSYLRIHHRCIKNIHKEYTHTQHTRFNDASHQSPPWGRGWLSKKNKKAKKKKKESLKFPLLRLLVYQEDLAVSHSSFCLFQFVVLAIDSHHSNYPLNRLCSLDPDPSPRLHSSSAI